MNIRDTRTTSIVCHLLILCITSNMPQLTGILLVLDMPVDCAIVKKLELNSKEKKQ